MSRSATKTPSPWPAIALSMAWACGSNESPLESPAHSQTPSPPTTRAATIPSPVDASHGLASADTNEQGAPPESTSADTPSAQWPPNGKKCRLLHCSNQLFFVGEAPDGWKGELSIEACVRDRCETQLVDLRQVKKEGVVPVGQLVVTVRSAPFHCSAIVRDECESTDLGRRLFRQSQGQSLLVIEVNPNAAGRSAVEVSLRLTKGKLSKTFERAAVDFREQSWCQRPNGSGCEPECCQAVREF